MSFKPAKALLHSSQCIAPLRSQVSGAAIRQVVPIWNRHFHPSGSRSSVHSPLGASPVTTRKKVTLQTLSSLYAKKEPITMLTAHDFPSASIAEAAGIEIVLVGDSLAMVALGMGDTSEVTLDEMVMHCRSVSRAAKTAFIVGDLPMGSYEVSPEQGVQSAIRLIKEGRVHGVKLEGGKEMAMTVKRIVDSGIPVVGHIGLTPQRQNALGGFRVQGKTVSGAIEVLEDAKVMQEAGVSLLVLEAIPAEVAEWITGKLDIPTIGIGAGNGCSGQVLVQVDMSGYYPPGRFLPKFVKPFGDVWSENFKAVQQYRVETKSREYPSKEYTYPMAKTESESFSEFVKDQQCEMRN